MGANLFSGAAGTLAASVFWGLQAHAADVDVAIVFAVDFSSSIDPDLPTCSARDMPRHSLRPRSFRPLPATILAASAWPILNGRAPDARQTCCPGQGSAGLKMPKRPLGDQREGRYRLQPQGPRRNIRFLGHRRWKPAARPVSGKRPRKVIDISANGENNDGLPVQLSRLNAIAKGYTINAIAIPAKDENPDYRLASYFADNVIGGPQAFVITPTGHRRLRYGAPPETGDRNKHERRSVSPLRELTDDFGEGLMACPSMRNYWPPPTG